MLQAYILINSELGAEKGLLKELKQISNIKEAYRVYGAYDIIVKIEAESKSELHKFIVQKIRKLPEVHSTLTMAVTNKGMKIKVRAHAS